MAVNISAYNTIKSFLNEQHVQLIAVSKTKSVDEILELYHLGQRDFGENYVQELVEKAEKLPKDIRWHFIGHLQTNKVKLIVPFVQLIHGIDSLKLLNEINKQAAKCKRVIECLIQVHIALEETKYGFDEEELKLVMNQVAESEMSNVQITGLMGMASFTENLEIVKEEFKKLNALYVQYPKFSILSMGMSSDYKLAVEEGSTMVRIGSLLFGKRE